MNTPWTAEASTSVDGVPYTVVVKDANGECVCIVPNPDPSGGPEALIEVVSLILRAPEMLATLREAVQQLPAASMTRWHLQTAIDDAVRGWTPATPEPYHTDRRAAGVGERGSDEDGHDCG